MSMVATFIRVAPGELRRLQDEPSWMEELMLVRDEEPNQPDGYLDTAWDGLDFLFDAAGLPLRLQDDGDPIGNGHFGWSPEVVDETAELLHRTPFESLAVHYDPDQLDDDVHGSWIDEEQEDLDYLRQYYEVLTAFFTSAAASGSAAVLEFTN